MPRRLSLAVCLLSVLALPTQSVEAQTLPDGYTLRDTTRYRTFSTGGQYALLRRQGRLIDTVDVDFGVHRVAAGTLLFLPVSEGRHDPYEPSWFTLGEHVLYANGGRRTTLNEHLPHFSDGYSSPALLGGKLYYWGIAQPGRRLYAVRYAFRHGTTRVVALEDTMRGTDFRFHLLPPTESAGSIVYRGQGRRYYLAPDSLTVRRVERRPAPRN